MLNSDTALHGAGIKGGQGGEQIALMVPGKIRNSTSRQAKASIQPTPSYSPKDARSPAFDPIRIIDGGSAVRGPVQGQSSYHSARGANPVSSYVCRRLSPSPNGAISQNPSQGYIEFMNAQTQYIGASQAVSPAPYIYAQAHAAGASVLTNRRDSKIPLSVVGGKPAGQARIHGARMKSQLGMHQQANGVNSFQISGANQSFHDPNILALPSQFQVPLQAINSPGSHILVSQGYQPEETVNFNSISSQHQTLLPSYNQVINSLNGGGLRAVSGLSQKNSNSGRRLSGYETSNHHIQPLQQLAPGQMKQNGGYIQQQLFSPQTSNAQLFESQAAQAHSMANTVVGCFSNDPGDRSTTAGTTLPNLTPSKNSFYKKHRQKVSLNNLSQQQPPTNIHVAQLLESTSLQNGGLQNQMTYPQQMATTIIQFNGGMPSLAQVQTIGGMTQKSLKMRKIPGMTHKFVNNQSQQNQQRLNSNSSATDEESHHSNHSSHKGQMLQIAGEKVGIKGEQSNRLAQGKKNSPLGMNSKPKNEVVAADHTISNYQSKFSSISELNKSGKALPHPTYSHEKSNSPILMPPSLKHKLQTLLKSDTSPVIKKTKNVSKVNTCVNVSQFYSAGIQRVSTSIQDPGTSEGQEIATLATPQINGVKRDIKIRKVNPSIGKTSQRIQSLHHNLSATPQIGTIPNASPLTITSMQSLNVYNRGPQNSEASNIMVSATSLNKRNPNNDSSPVSTLGTRGGARNLFSGLPRSSQREDTSLAQVYSTLQKRAIEEQIVSTQASYQRNVVNIRSDASSAGGRSSLNNSAFNSENTAPIYQTAAKSTTKSTISSDDRRRKFTTHVKLYNQKIQLMQQSIELKQLNGQQAKLTLNFAPKVLPANTTSQLSLNNTFAPNPKQFAAFNNTKGNSKEWQGELNTSQTNEESLNGSIGVLHLESYDILSHSPDNPIKAQLINPVRDPSPFLDETSLANDPQPNGYGRLQISGFEQDLLPKIEKSPNVIVTKPAEDHIEQKSQSKNRSQDGILSKSPSDNSPSNNPKNKLAVIEEEFVDETNKSVQSRTILRAPASLSNRSLSNNSSTKGGKNEETKRQSIIGLNISQDLENPILNRFLNWRKNSEAFRKLFRKIWESGVNPTKDLSEDGQALLEELSIITQQGNQLTVEEIKRCIVSQRKNQALRDKFQNPYIKRMRQRSLGTASRSNDYLNFSMGTQPKNNASQSSIIEENIIIHPSNSMSLINSPSHVNNHLQIPGQQGSLFDKALALNQAQQLNVKKTQARQDYVYGEQELQMSSSGGDQSKIAKSLAVVDSYGNSGSSGPPGPISKKQASFESQSYHVSKLPLSQNELKRLQFSSQKHQSNKVQMVNHKSGGSGMNDNSSNSLVGNALNSSFNKVKSFQHQNSQDGTISYKSDQNQNRLNKHSSGSDSYYIPQSGESFQYQPIAKTFGQRQSKSMVRQGAGASGTAMIDHPLGSAVAASKNFNDILNGQKATFTNRVAAPVSEKIQGTLKKWREIRKLGQGTSGEVFLVQDIVKNAQPQYFVVKKLQIVSPNSGIDKEAIIKLRNEIEVYKKLSHENIVKFYGSEIVGREFCIYLEYMSGGTIQSNYQSHPMQRLGEKQVRLYTKQMLVGLSFLHEKKVVHGDLKGANVLVDDSRKTVKLTDFGSAKLVESTVSQSDVNCVIRGSLAWMAPEVLNNRGIRRKADIWSLGCLVIEMAVGGNPWGTELASLDNNYQALMRIVDPTKSPPVPEDLSAECKDFISRCLTREYDKRPTAQELLAHPWIAASIEKKQGIMQQLQEHI